MIEGLRGQPVRLDHERDVGRLHGDLDVVETDLIEVGELHPCGLDKRLRRGAAVLLVQAGMQRTGIHADADRDAAVTRLGGDKLDLLGLAQIPRVQPEPLNSGFEGSERHLVVEVHVGHDGHRRAGDDYSEAFGRLLLVARATHDVGPGRGKRVHLGEGPLGVGRLRHRHGLDRYRRAAANWNLSYLYLAGFAPFGQRRACSGHRSPA